MIEDPEGLKYFGHTKNIKHRWQPNHYKGCGLYSAIKKYGWKSLKKTIIADHLSEQDAKKIEAWMIERYDTLNPEKGYNKQAGDIYNVNRDIEAKRTRMREWNKKCREGYSPERIEQIKEYQRQYAKEHGEERREYGRQWYAKNREHRVEYQRKRKERIRQQKNN